MTYGQTDGGQSEINRTKPLRKSLHYNKFILPIIRENKYIPSKILWIWYFILTIYIIFLITVQSCGLVRRVTIYETSDLERARTQDPG